MPSGTVAEIERRQLKLKRIPVGIQDEMKETIFIPRFDGDSQAVGRMAKVRLVELDAVPGLFRFAEQLTQALALTVALELPPDAPFDEHCDKTVQVGMFFKQRPI